MKKILILTISFLFLVVCLLSCDAGVIHLGHRYEYIVYETGHYKQFTCGCPSPDIIGEHYDHNDDGLCDVCSYQMVNHFIRNQAGAEWLSEISADDITEIKMISGGGGPLPPISKTYISSSTDKAVISSIFEEYYWLDSKPVSEEQTQIPDGGYFKVQFILNDGSVKSLYFINGDFYFDGNGNYFELVRLPVFRDGTNFVNKYGFEAIENHFQIRLMDGTLVCEIPVSAFEFMELTDDIYLDDIAPTYYIEIRGVKISFIRDSYFYINDNRSVYYDLVGKNLDEIIAYATEPNYSILIDAYWEKIPQAESVSVVHYYGEFSSGAIAAMMSCSEYDFTEALWDEVIDGVVIHYNNGNRIIVLYEGEFYSLTVAYNNGYITNDDLVAISEKHKEFFPYLYE